MRGRWCWMLLACGPALLWGAPEARAGNLLGPVAFVEDGVWGSGLNAITYDATRVKRNRSLSVTVADYQTVTILDPEAEIHLLSTRCEHIPGGARCTLDDVGVVDVQLGPGDDRGTFFGPVDVRGGDGDDVLLGGQTLSGGPGHDTLEARNVEGGDGNDRISCTGIDCSHRGDAGNDTMTGGPYPYWPDGGPGNDRLHGGSGDDRLLGGPGDDVLDGGDGLDLADYRDRVDRPVSVTLDGVDRDGEPGEADRLVSVEGTFGSSPGNGPVGGDSPEGDWLSGSPGPDVLLGTNGHSDVRGLGGNDDLQMLDARQGRLQGGDGDDALFGVNATLEGGEGNDEIRTEGIYYRGDTIYRGSSTVYGGPGDDTVYAGRGINEGYPDNISCGPGWDTVEAQVEDVVRLDCEVVTRGG